MLLSASVGTTEVVPFQIQADRGIESHPSRKKQERGEGGAPIFRSELDVVWFALS